MTICAKCHETIADNHDSVPMGDGEIHADSDECREAAVAGVTRRLESQIEALEARLCREAAIRRYYESAMCYERPLFFVWETLDGEEVPRRNVDPRRVTSLVDEVMSLREHCEQMESHVRVLGGEPQPRPVVPR